MDGKVVSINLSERKGVRKTPVGSARLRPDFGIEGDAHASGTWHRQVSLLALESIEKMRARGLQVGPGDFAENITTQGVDLLSLPLGMRIRLGEEVEAEVSQHGKVCHDRCEIYRQAGDCVMPREGIFVTVVKGGLLRAGDPVRVPLPLPGNRTP
jgi:MOSC domain-containing protein YiiM